MSLQNNPPFIVFFWKTYLFLLFQKHQTYHVSSVSEWKTIFFFWAELGEAVLCGEWKEIEFCTWGMIVLFYVLGSFYPYGRNWLDAVLEKRKIFDQAADSAFQRK